MKHLFYGNDGLAAWVQIKRGLPVARWFRSIPMSRKLLHIATEAALSGAVEVEAEGETFEVIKECD